MTTNMKLNVQHLNIRSLDALDSWVENQILALGCARQIDEANIRLVRRPDASPAYLARVHLVTPGPDVIAERSDHTLRAAVTKVMRELRKQIMRRATKPLQKLKTNLGGHRSR
jgi:ribosome-associated translation inhibitor RaiA